MPESSLRSYLDGKSAPGLDKLVDISRATGASIDWMAFGSGSRNNAEQVAGTVPIAVFSATASAGPGSFKTGGASGVVNMPSDLVSRLGSKVGFLRALTASGRSMEPTIGDGDLLLVDTAPGRRDPLLDGAVYVLSVGDALFVKRLRKSAKGWIMASDNRALYPDELLPAGEPIKVHGQVVWTGRSLS